MYYQNYEDYMRSVLGYPIERQNTYENYNTMPYEHPAYPVSTRYSEEIMELYPEIYKLLNPMVCKMCESNTKPITRELLEQMTEEIYLNIENSPEINTVINVRVNLPNEKADNNKSAKAVSSNRTNSLNKTDIKTSNQKEVEDRSIRRNPTLQDLIKILILNQLLGGNRPNRPHPYPPYQPYPPQPPRPREDRGYYNF